MEIKKNNKYVIRKFTIGTGSVLIASLVFISQNQAHAEEVNIGEKKVSQKTTKAEAAPKAETAPKAEVEPKVEAAPKAEVEPKVEAAPKAEVEPKVEAAPKAEA
ncbi:YSIRK-type signal peptide-containing protein, partial [Staphylococcus aureus]|uniref:YSIRK-type signal peptide-containing protein n=1 Tax=Staphylococcus aureus TaxID=1280 RepID=UPI0018EC2C82